MQNSMSISYSGLCLLGTTNGCWRKSGGWGNTATEVERDCIPDYCGDKTQPVSPWCPLNSSSTHTDTHSASILLELYSHGYESAGKTRLSFAVALAIFTHTETPPLKHTLEQTQSHTDRKKKKWTSLPPITSCFSLYMRLQVAKCTLWQLQWKPSRLVFNIGEQLSATTEDCVTTVTAC